jgi:hypothetical protein
LKQKSGIRNRGFVGKNTEVGGSSLVRRWNALLKLFGEEVGASVKEMDANNEEASSGG